MDSILPRELTDAESAPFCFKEEFSGSEETPFRLRIVAGELDSNPDLVFIDKCTGNEYTLPFNIDGIESLQKEAAKKLDRLRHNYKMAYGEIGKRFNLYPIVSSYRSFSDNQEEVPYCYFLDEKDAQRDNNPRKPFLVFDENYSPNKIKKYWNNLNAEEKAQCGGWELTYAGKVLTCVPWNDREGIENSIALMRDPESLESLFALTYPQEAETLVAEENLATKKARTLAALVDWQRKGLFIDGTNEAIEFPKISHRLVAKELRAGRPYELIEDYLTGRNQCRVAHVMFDGEYVPIGLQIRLRKDPYRNSQKNLEQKKETFIEAIEKATGWKVFTSSETDDILPGNKEVKHFYERLFLTHPDIYRVIKSDFPILKESITFDTKGGASWF